MPGTLYIIATPIGNLEDMTLRGLRLLKEVDVIACEDTRQTQKLLNHFGIQKRTISYHQHNEADRSQEILALLAEGKSVAIVSDAGTPGISDPGNLVVRSAVAAGVAVVPVPGPAAFVAAMVASGMPADSFRFVGFLPSKAGPRKTALEGIRTASEPVIFYEAPHRIVDTLQDVVATLGASRPVVIARELTKIHEEFLRGSAQEVLAKLCARESVKGEIVLIIAPRNHEELSPQRPDAAQRLMLIMQEQQLDEKTALKSLAKELGLGKSELYRELQRLKKL